MPASNLRQVPLLLHISMAPAKPPLSFQSSTVSIFCVAYSGLKRNSERLSCFEGLTILPGFINPFGSNNDLISPNAAVNRGPRNGAIHSDRTRPSPCSPE